jgi:uncharacterized membrane protein
MVFSIIIPVIAWAVFLVSYFLAWFIPGFLDDIIAWIIGVIALLITAGWFGQLIYELGSHLGTFVLTVIGLAVVVFLVVFVMKYRANKSKRR